MRSLHPNNILLDPAAELHGGALVDEPDVGGSDNTESSGDTGPALDLDDIMSPDSGTSTPNPNSNRAAGLPAGVKPKTPKPTDEQSEQTTEETAGEEDKEDAGDKQEKAKSGEQPEPAESKDTPGPGRPASKRDYSQFAEDEVKVLKKLGNREFGLVAPILSAAKADKAKVTELTTKNTELLEQLAGRGIPQAWHEHPQAYTLTPEYTRISQQYTQLSSEEEHYQRQLAAVQAGEEWTAIIGYDRDGSPRYSNPQAATPRSQAQLMSIISQAAAKRANLEGSAQQIQANFKARHEADTGALTGAIEQHIASLAPEIRPKDEEFRQIHAKFPATFRSSPYATSMAKLVNVIINQGKLLEKYANEAKIKVAASAERRMAGPGANTGRPAAAPKPQAKNGRPAEFNLDDILGDSE